MHTDDRSTGLTRAIDRVTGWLGSSVAILVSFLTVIAWAAVGVVVGVFVEDAYQLVINTTTTIATFWMVFVIQNAANRADRAMQAKLDAQSEVLGELAAQLGANSAAVTRLAGLVGVEDAPEKVIRADQAAVRAAATRRQPPTPEVAE